MPSIAIPVSLRGQLLSGARPTLTNILFSANEPGFTFEPWDITTLYQDRAGTTPVTAAGQSVGLRLSKDQGLRIGPELGFATLQVSDLTVIGGSVVVTDLGDRLRLTRTAAAGGPTQAQVSSGVVSAGQYYRASFTLLATGTSNNAYIGVNNGGGTDFIPSAYYAGASAQSRLQIATAEGTGRLILRLAVSRGANPASSIEGDWIEISKTYSVKSLAGNHEVAVSDAKRGVYGWMPKTGKRNLLTYTEQFDNAAWTKSLANTVADSTNSPNGVATGDTVRLNAGTSLITPAIGLFTNAAPYVSEPTSSSLTAAAHTYSLYVKGGVGLTHVQLRVGTVATLNPAVASMVVRLSDGVVIDGVGTVTNIGAGWFRVSMPFTASAAVHHCGIWFWNSTSIASAAGTEGIYVWGSQLEVGSTATAYQRVNSQYDITEAGVPTCYYVQADGVDDAYVTPTITPNTDKVQVFAGMRKLSDATTGALLESSVDAGSNAGTILLLAPDANASPRYGFYSRGSVASGVASSPSSSFAAPISNVVTGIGDISADVRTIRINASSIGTSSSDQGTGNYLAYPAYIYGRGGTSLPFNGLDFGHAVRFGPNLDAATIARVEALIARNTPEVTL